MNIAREPSASYAVAIPTVDDGTFNFYFLARLPNGTYRFTFKWYLDRWNVEVTLPSGDTRLATIYPNVLAWSEYLDVSLAVRTDLESVGQNDLSKISLYMVYWS